MSTFLLRNIPNFMSWSRFLLCFLGMHIFYLQHYKAAILVLFLGWMTDFWDGRMARYLNVQSKFGRWLDHAADRFTLLIVYYVLYPFNPYFVLLAVPGILNSIIQIVFALYFKKEVKVTQADRLWFLLATFVFPVFVIMQLAYPYYLHFLSSYNVYVMALGVILGFTSIIQYSKQTCEAIRNQ